MRKRLTACALLAAVVMATPSVAQAASRTIHDTVGDVHYGMDIKTATVRNGKPLWITIKHRATWVGDGTRTDVRQSRRPGAPLVLAAEKHVAGSARNSRSRL